MRKVNFILGFMLIFIFASSLLFAQTAEQLEKAQEEIEKERLLREKIEEEKPKPEIEEEKPAPTEVPAPISEEKILIKKIKVTGVTLLLETEINDIILPFENKELNLREMQKAADLITDAYRRKGYITSRAYLPPQKIEEGILEVRVVEGITGDIEIKGNRYFKTKLIRNMIVLKKGEPFDYEILRKGLSKINEQPDRSAKAVLAPGKELGTTDIVLEVKDRLPIHIGFDWDNYGSRYIDQDRFKTTLTHNNFLGWDDILTFQYQLVEGENYRLLNLHYLLPITEDLRLGFFAARSKLDLGKDYEDLNARGKSQFYSIYVIQSLIDKENVDLSLNLGFDYKDIFNFQLGSETSRDRLRVAKIGLDLDLSDPLGRTLISNEIDYGIPDIMGGLKEKDSSEQGTEASKGHGGSRAGSGGKFVKDNLNLIRLQRMPFNTTLLWKNQLQFSPYILTAAEQFQIGGISNVRGYPPAEAVGDRGYTMSWEWSFPAYFVPKDFKVPLSKAKFYDAIRVVTFYDWANTRLRRPQAGEEKNKTLRAAGCGLRFNLPEDFSVRLEFAWPLDNTPSDGEHLHTWTEISKSF